MKTGFDLLLWTTHVTDEHWPIIDALKAAGYDGIEIPMFGGEIAHYEEIGRRLKDRGLDSTGVAGIPAGNCISPDASERQKALDGLKWMIDCTVAIGATTVAGPFHQPLGVFSGKGPTADEVKWCAEVHKPAAHYAATAGVTLAVEPVNRFECYFLNTIDQAVALCKAVNEPNYGYLFDTFHTNIEENDVPALIRSSIAHIRHVHITENNRGVPGAGHIPFQPIFNALRQSGWDGWLTVESFGSALPDLSAATKIWRPLFKSEADVYEGAIKLMREGWAKAAS